MDDICKELRDVNTVKNVNV